MTYVIYTYRNDFVKSEKISLYLQFV